ncbi:MAG: ATP-binding protein [Bacteroides sp.]|nr:ATP-binding protein [Bacteroides sp.]
MKTPDRFTKVKVAVGYLALLTLLFFALSLIYQEVQMLSRIDTEQNVKSDSLLSLIRQKDESTIQILQNLTEANQVLLDTVSLQRLLNRPVRQVIENIPKQGYSKVIEKQDSVVTTTRKKGFLQRLAEVFVPSKDSNLIINRSLEQYTDSLLVRVQTSTVVQERLEAQVRELNRRRMAAYQQVRLSNQRLQKINENLTTQIDSLVTMYEEQGESLMQEELAKQQQIRERSTRIIGWLAMGAITLSLIFLSMIWMDITRSRRYRRELEIAKAHTEELLAAREKMMLTITHDFKAPLGSIIGYIELLSRLINDKREKFYLDNMKSSSQHLLKLVNDLLDFHRLDLNKAEIHQVGFNPSHLFEDIKVSFEPLLKEKGLLFNYEIAAELDDSYLSDPLRIRQIVTNLLSNAVKFTNQGSVSLNVHYKKAQLIITVSDTGKGMKPSDKDRIFQEFTRLPGAQGEEGFGLGLSIVRKLIYLLEGTIEVESMEGKGSTFIVHLPLYPILTTTPSESQKQTKVIEKELLDPHSLRVLLIDDDKIQLNLTAAMLQEAGITTVCCQQLEHLTELLRRERFDVLLTDLQMPAINGLDLLKLLRASNIPQAQTIPVIAVTARSEMTEEEFIQHGFVARLNKPFTAKDLLKSIGVNISSVSQKTETSTTKKLNIQALTAYSEGDKEAANSIIRSFIAETTKNAEMLKKASLTKDMKTLTNIAHKLLPLFTLINVEEIIPQLTWLEDQRGNAYSRETAVKVKQILTQIEQVLKMAEQEIN